MDCMAALNDRLIGAFPRTYAGPDSIMVRLIRVVNEYELPAATQPMLTGLQATPPRPLMASRLGLPTMTQALPFQLSIRV